MTSIFPLLILLTGLLAPTFEKYMDDGSDYYVILSRWNGEEASDQIHTFMVDKDSGYGTKYHAYNFVNDDSTTNYSNYSKYFVGSIENTFICAYFVEK